MNHFTVEEVYPFIFGIGEFATEEKVISYLIVGDKYCFLFDTGLGLSSIKNCILQITNLPIIVINSHSHYDHIGGNREFETVWMYRHELSHDVQKGISRQELDNKPYITPPYYGDGSLYFIKPFACSKYIDSSDILSIGDYKFEVVCTPGHSPDSIALYEKSHQLLLSGDFIYNGPIYLQLPESSFIDYKKTVYEMAQYDYKYILGSHNAFFCPNTIFALMSNLFLTQKDEYFIKNPVIADVRLCL